MRWLMMIQASLAASLAGSGFAQTEDVLADIAGGLTEDPTYNTVQVATYNTRAQAETRAAQLESDGFTPVEVTEASVEGTYAVLFGRFETHVDALLYAQDMEAQGLIDGADVATHEGEAVPEIVPVDEESADAASGEPEASPMTMSSLSGVPQTEIAAPANRGPLRPVFSMARRAWSQTDALPSLQDTAIYEDLEQIDETGTDDSYRSALISARAQHNTDDHVRGYIEANLGVLDIKAGDYDAALEHLRPVADGDIAANSDHRVMAMIRVAWITHQQDDRLHAYQAYGEIARVTHSDAVRARCAVERAGLLMEMARAEQRGTLADCRQACEQVLADFGDDPAMHARCATAALMRAETFYFDDNRQVAIAALTDVAEDYADIEREATMAYFFLGYTQRREGNTGEALEIFRHLSQYGPGEGEIFAHQDLVQKGYREYVRLAMRTGQFASAEAVLSEFRQSQPRAPTSKPLTSSWLDTQQRPVSRRPFSQESLGLMSFLPINERTNIWLLSSPRRKQTEDLVKETKCIA